MIRHFPGRASGGDRHWPCAPGQKLALGDSRGLIGAVMIDGRAHLGLLCMAVAGLAGCAYYTPHSVVPSNIVRTADKDTLVSGQSRVEAELCGNRLLSIPFGPEPRISALMEALGDQARNASGFEDIRIDQSFVNYIYPLFWQECVHGSAVPLFAANRRPPKPAQKGAPPPSPSPAAPPSTGAGPPEPGTSATPSGQP
jgi:hypothetical protein